MTIRHARLSDISSLVEMGGRFVRSSAYGKILADDADARKALMRRLIESSDGAIFVSQRNGHLTGMIGVAAYQHPWSGQWIAGELFWWVEPEARGSGIKLLKRAEYWMKSKGCAIAQMVAPNDRVARVYQRLGYAKLEEAWQRSL
jgi:Acetyltransferase (GNAT) family.